MSEEDDIQVSPTGEEDMRKQAVYGRRGGISEDEIAREMQRQRR